MEQFDVQSPELTVRETILFSARLRIDPDLLKSEEDRESFVDGVIKAVELTSLADALVGNDDGSGLSFEQKKRLSIAVELAASPSIIFLDEVCDGRNRVPLRCCLPHSPSTSPPAVSMLEVHRLSYGLFG